MNQPTKLLIIDDDEGDRRLIHEAVKKAGFEVEVNVAQNGEEGIKKANELKPVDIIVVDTVLPGIDGFETCRKIKELDENLKVVICTGVVDAVDAGKARSAGADDYCVKTSDGEPLINAIRTMLPKF